MRARRFLTLLNRGAGDSTKPTVTITCTQTSPTTTSPLNFTFTLSEVATDFAIGDITVGNGTAGNFAGSGTSYTCDVTPTTAGAVTVDVAADAFHDAAGNGNTAATQFSITYMAFVFRDDFTTNDAAPITSPRTAEPGPGTLTITDTGNKAGIAGNKLVLGTLTTTSVDPILLGDLSAVTGGTAMIFIGNISSGANNHFQAGFRATGQNRQATINALVGNFFGTHAAGSYTALGYSPISADVDYNYAVIRRTSGGYFLLIKGGVYTNWTIIGVFVSPTLAATEGVFIGPANTDLNSTIDSIRVVNLIAPWTTDYGIATQQLAGARSAGDTFTHEANCLIEFVVTTRPSALQLEVRFRIQDASNYWQVTVDSTGALDLDEVVAGVATQRGTAAGVVSNGERIVILADGQTIRVWEQGTLRITYTSASNFQAATSGKLETEGTDGSVTNIVSYPRLLSGTALSVLNAANP
jgi:hypothetical protein